jgi:C1A family cysteine protease
VNIQSKYHLVKSRVDERDYKYADHFSTVSAKALPPAVDLRPTCPPIYDQGQIGSCTANALVGGMNFLEIKDKKNAAIMLSRLFVYYNERRLEGSTAQDAGATLRDGMKALSTWGVCKENLWAYISNLVTHKPNVQAYSEGLNRKITSYFALNNVLDMKNCLASGYPFVGGIQVYDSFESDAVALTGVVPYPNVDTEELLGGHAVLFVGYNDAKDVFIGRNSWGTGWGQKGYFTIPQRFLADADLADDFWTIRKGNNI